MKRVPGLVSVGPSRSTIVDGLSRRDFCAYTCLGAAFAGCIDGGSGAVQTGGLNGSDGTMSPDSGVIQNPDGGGSGSAVGQCVGTNVDVGLASSFVANVPKAFGSPNYFFVMRDANGLYALTSKCSHEHVILTPTSTQFHCNAHGADFTFNGAVIDGPTTKALVHYAMCTLPNGHVGVQTAMQVPASSRLVA